MATFRRDSFWALFAGLVFLTIIALLAAINVNPPAKRVAIVGDSFALLAPWYVVQLCVFPDVSVAEINSCAAIMPRRDPLPTDIIVMAGMASIHLGEPQEEVERWLDRLTRTLHRQFPNANIYLIPLSDMQLETERNPRGADWLHMSAAGYKALCEKHLKPLGSLAIPPPITIER